MLILYMNLKYIPGIMHSILKTLKLSLQVQQFNYCTFDVV